MDELKEAALAYAARGWAVFRLQEMAKVPFRGSNGVLDATSDPAQIAAWWDETPNANIGIAAGASGLLLVDVDNKDGRDGFTSWDVQRVTHLVDDTTPHVWTPHNGKHLYFAAPPGLDLRNTDDELGPGIETKANGKYLVAPPSRLPEGFWRWDERLNLDTVPLAMFPPSLAAQIVKQPKVARPPMDYRPTSDAGATIVDALRHLDPWAGSYEWWLDILMGIHNALPGGDGLQIAEAWGDGKDGEIAGKWKGFDADGGVTVGTLYYEAERRGWVPPWRQTRTVTQAQPGADEPPGWLDDESAGIELPHVTTTKPEAKVTITAAPARNATEPKPDLSQCPPLPASAQLDPALAVGASPWLDAYLDFSRLWAPRAYDGFHESVGLWVLSTVAARRVRVDLGGERYTNLYFANVARSSVFTKSTAHKIGSELIEVVGLRHLLAPDDSTPQALLQRMGQQSVTSWDTLSSEDQTIARLRIAFASQKGWDFDEFGHKVAAMMRDSGPMADFRGILRKLDDCPKSYEYLTIAHGSVLLDRPYLSLLGSMTPADMRPYAKPGGALWGDGFWARFAFVAPPPEEDPIMGRFPTGTRSIPHELSAPLRNWHNQLGSPTVEVVERNEADENGKPRAKKWDVYAGPAPVQTCVLSAGVFDAFYNYHDALVTLAQGNDNTDLDGNYSRFAEKALRVAALLASLENRGLIELRHWARAQAITERWRQSLHNLYRTLNATRSEESRNEDRVTEIITKLGTATGADVHRFAPDIATTEAVVLLDRMTRAGVLQCVSKTHKGTQRYSLIES